MSKGQIAEKINEFLGTLIVKDTLEKDDIAGIHNIDTLQEYILKLIFEELDALKNLAIDLESFYSLEKRIVLSSIDELWMRHIDAMSRLREEVAFEGYAQRNPLIVYKEKAFTKFADLIGELEYKVTKSMFSINKITDVAQVEISDADLTLNDINLDEMIKINAQDFQNNPLFAQPKNTQKNKIRI